MESEKENEQRKDKPDSIKVSKTSTGKYSFEVKMYFDSENEDYKSVVQEIEDCHKLLRLKFTGGQ